VKPLPAPIWFVAAFIPMVASQVLRLHQLDAGGWLFWNYAGRLAALAVLAAMARPVAFRREKLRRTPSRPLQRLAGGQIASVRDGAMPLLGLPVLLVNGHGKFTIDAVNRQIVFG
jgi:hypothetical protein